MTSEVIAVTSSGREVPNATKVSAITLSGTPIACAINVPLSTSKLAPTAISAAPKTSKSSVLTKDIFSSASSFVSVGAFFICITLAIMYATNIASIIRPMMRVNLPNTYAAMQ